MLFCHWLILSHNWSLKRIVCKFSSRQNMQGHWCKSIYKIKEPRDIHDSVKLQAIVYIFQVVRWETRYIMVSQTIRVSQTSLVSNCSYLNILDHWISAIDKHKLVGTLFLDSTQSLWFSLPCHFKALSVW